MPNRNYERGRRFEYRVRDALRAEGWHAWRTPGSKSPADVIALKAGRAPLLVQCKLAAYGLDDTLKLAAMAAACGAMPIMAERGPGRRVVIRYRVVAANGTLGPVHTRPNDAVNRAGPTVVLWPA